MAVQQKKSEKDLVKKQKSFKSRLKAQGRAGPTEAYQGPITGSGALTYKWLT